MQATIYVTEAAYETAQTIKDLDYYHRTILCDDIPDFEKREGYHFKNADKLNLLPLPAQANVARSIAHGSSSAGESPQVTMPANLRGCIFEQAPVLPDRYAEIVTYWSGETVNASTSGAVYFQCPLNEYMVNLGPDPVEGPVVNDRLLSEGVVVAVSGLAATLSALSPEDFIEIVFPVDLDMLGIEPDGFRSSYKYGGSTDHLERVYLKVKDILNSPDQDRVFIDLLCNELIDYGYWY